MCLRPRCRKTSGPFFRSRFLLRELADTIDDSRPACLVVLPTVPCRREPLIVGVDDASRPDVTRCIASFCPRPIAPKRTLSLSSDEWPLSEVVHELILRMSESPARRLLIGRRGMAQFGRKRRWHEDNRIRHTQLTPYRERDFDWEEFPKWDSSSYQNRYPYWEGRPYRNRYTRPRWKRQHHSFKWMLRDFLIRLGAFILIATLGLAWVKFHFLGGMFQGSF